MVTRWESVWAKVTKKKLLRSFEAHRSATTEEEAASVCVLLGIPSQKSEATGSVSSSLGFVDGWQRKPTVCFSLCHLAAFSSAVKCFSATCCSCSTSGVTEVTLVKAFILSVNMSDVWLPVDNNEEAQLHKWKASLVSSPLLVSFPLRLFSLSPIPICLPPFLVSFPLPLLALHQYFPFILISLSSLFFSSSPLVSFHPHLLVSAWLLLSSLSLLISILFVFVIFEIPFLLLSPCLLSSSVLVLLLVSSLSSLLPILLLSFDPPLLSSPHLVSSPPLQRSITDHSLEFTHTHTRLKSSPPPRRNEVSERRWW